MANYNKAALKKARTAMRKKAKEGNEEAKEFLNRSKQKKKERRQVAKEAPKVERRKKVVRYNFEPGTLVKVTKRYAGSYSVSTEDAYIVIGTNDVKSALSSTDYENYWIDIIGPVGLITVRAGALRSF